MREDARIWAQWNHSFELSSAICAFSSWVSSGGSVAVRWGSILFPPRVSSGLIVGATVKWPLDGCNILCLLIWQATIFHWHKEFTAEKGWEVCMPSEVGEGRRREEDAACFLDCMLGSGADGLQERVNQKWRVIPINETCLNILCVSLPVSQGACVALFEDHCLDCSGEMRGGTLELHNPSHRSTLWCPGSSLSV